MAEERSQEDRDRRIEELGRLYGKSIEELKAELDRLATSPELRQQLDAFEEQSLHFHQPLVDYGWRVDYERMGISSPTRFIPLKDLRAAVDALESHLDDELWIAMSEYRRAHRGATYEECCAALLQAGTIREEWGIPERLWKHFWERLENEQPYPIQDNADS